MGNSQTFDVIVVGAGPGGSTAAKRCAESGLATLLIERKRLPRDKVCTGMVMGNWAHGIIRPEYGQIPDDVFPDPPYLTGHRTHLAGAEPQTLEWHTPLTWRKDLDFWMVQRAEEAESPYGTGYASPCNPGRGCMCASWPSIVARKTPARFVIGADGSTSVVRRSLFRLIVRYSTPIRECYRGKLDLQRDVIHWLFEGPSEATVQR